MGQQMPEQVPGAASEVQDFGALDEALLSAGLLEGVRVGHPIGALTTYRVGGPPPGSSGLLMSPSWNGWPEPSPRRASLLVENLALG